MAAARPNKRTGVDFKDPGATPPGAAEASSAAPAADDAEADEPAPRAKKPTAKPFVPSADADSAPAMKNPGRNGFLTVRDRNEFVEELPSLKEFPETEVSEAPVVDAEAIPPPAPPPPPPEPQASGLIDRGLPIPDHYGMDRVQALVRDPYWVFVYWELKGGVLERLRFKYSGDVMAQARWVLKVDAPLAQQTQVVDIDLRTPGWYLKVVPGNRYRVELGCFTPDGVYEAICASREVATPSVGISPVVSESWMVHREDLENLLQAGGAVWSQWLGGASERAPGLVRTDFPRAAAFFSGRFGQPPGDENK
ncbi:MAG: DUF4912 domain-containing protein [Planctomycetes bacterium]|nr:DUF4912 domain-containing protein [Planctomycetota bacterium]